MCGCPRDRLCDQCRAQMFLNLKGTAARRADTWLESLPPTVRQQPWPGATEKVFAIAMRKVEDLTADAKLRSLLAAELASWAAKRWTNPD